MKNILIILSVFLFTIGVYSQARSVQKTTYTQEEAIKILNRFNGTGLQMNLRNWLKYVYKNNPKKAELRHKCLEGLDKISSSALRYRTILVDMDAKTYPDQTNFFFVFDDGAITMENTDVLKPTIDFDKWINILYPNLDAALKNKINALNYENLKITTTKNITKVALPFKCFTLFATKAEQQVERQNDFNKLTD